MTRSMLSIAAALAMAASAAAHHSISSIYDGQRKVTVEGSVTQFQLINPHPFLFIEVRDNTGKTQQWRLEMDNRGELAAIGVTAATFKPGDRVVASGSLARAEPDSLYLLRLDRPADGFWYEQVGNSPRIRSPRP
ncbi:MAG: DUF6152 family protein [Acidobacteriota bacterium]